MPELGGRAAERLRRVEVIVLDIDDTLYLERDYTRSGFRAIEAELRLEGFADEAWQLFLDGVRGDTFDRVLRQRGDAPTPERVARLVEIYRGHRPSIDLAPDALGFLEAVHSRGRRLAAITDGPLASQRAKAEALGVARWAEPVIFTGDYGDGFGKPHPRAFEAVQVASGRPPEAHVYLADNPAKDFGGPRSLGWATVRVRRAGSLHEHVATPDGVDAEVVDLAALGSTDVWG